MSRPAPPTSRRPPLPGPPRRRRRGRTLLAAVLAVASLLLVAGGAVAAGRYARDRFFAAPPDYPGPGVGSVTVQVRPGETATAIARTLHSADVVRSVGAFVDVAQQNSRSVGISPGFYRLRRQMAAARALDALLDPSTRLRGQVTIPEGYTLRQVLQRVAERSDLSLPALEAAARSPGRLGLPAYARGRLEGFLFPATYDIEPDDTAVTLLRAMVDRFQAAAAELDLPAAARAGKLTPYEAVTVASLVEREARLDAERPMIARVIYNRLQRDMPLQIDATVQYALGEQKPRLSYEDLRVASPYNTYLRSGLPPGPIASPGLPALRAALRPATGPWLYYVVVDPATGRHAFATTYAEHLRNKAQAPG